MKKRETSAALRATLGGIAAAILASGTAASAAAEEQPNRANRLEASFTETRLSVLDRIADLGIRQVIVSGTGTLEGFGEATEMVAVSIDGTVAPCGPGSDSSTVMRRIVVSEGTLILKTMAHRCPTPSGLVTSGEYEVDGDSSTGVFAGARGSGSEAVDIATLNTVRISGQLHFAQP
jgi:hypothetical protein